MLRKLCAHFRQQFVGYLALFVAMGGTTYATATIGSGNIKNNAVLSRHIKDGEVKNADLAANSVGGGKVIDNTLTGADINESTLQGVNAASVGGLTLRKINFVAPHGTLPTTVLALGGLVLTAECKSSGGPLVIVASTTKDHAGLHATGVDAAPNDLDATRDFSGGTFGNGDLRGTDSVNVSGWIPTNTGTETLNYTAPDGTVVVVQLAVELQTPQGVGCTLTGVASGG